MLLDSSGGEWRSLRKVEIPLVSSNREEREVSMVLIKNK